MRNVKKELSYKHKSKEDALLENEVEDLIDACKNKKEKFVIITLIYTGMRVGELIHMRKSWLNWQDERIEIPLKRECDCNECKVYRNGVWSPKTKAGERKIKLLDPRVKTILREYFTLFDEINMTRAGVWHLVKRVAKRTKIPHKIYPHAIRATAAHIFAHNHKFTAPTLAYVMGWKSITMAEEYIKSEEGRALKEMEERKDERRSY